MTTLYKPVLVESAAQAEALPGGTLAYLEHYTSSPDALDPSKLHPFVARSTASKATNDWWLTSGNARSDAEMVGWTALVPIEAKEETRSRDVTPILTLNDPRWSLDRGLAAEFVTETRLVTPWEAV